MKKVFLLIFMIMILMSNIVNATTYKEEEDKTPKDLQKYFDDFDKNLSLKYIKDNFQKIIDDLNEFLHKYTNDNIVKLRILRLIALNYVDIEKFDDARYYLEQAYNINPESARINSAYGYLELNLKNYNEALKYFYKSFTLDSDNDSRSSIEQNIAAVYFEQKNI